MNNEEALCAFGVHCYQCFKLQGQKLKSWHKKSGDNQLFHLIIDIDHMYDLLTI